MLEAGSVCASFETTIVSASVPAVPVAPVLDFEMVWILLTTIEEPSARYTVTGIVRTTESVPFAIAEWFGMVAVVPAYDTAPTVIVEAGA